MTAISDHITAGAEDLARQTTPKVRAAAESAFDSIKPVLALALPLARRLNWRIVAFGVIAGAAAYLVRAMLNEPEHGAAGSRSHSRHKPPELDRWESEGGMVATSAPSAPAAADAQGRSDEGGDAGGGAAEPPVNS